MPGPILHIGAIVNCGHGGVAQPTVPNSRVVVSGQPTVLQSTPYAVAGCTNPPPAGGPCVTGNFLTGSTRVRSMGQPLLLLDSISTAVPNGVPLLPLSAQTRVIAQ